jgi:hypothetical protein
MMKLKTMETIRIQLNTLAGLYGKDMLPVSSLLVTLALKNQDYGVIPGGKDFKPDCNTIIITEPKTGFLRSIISFKKGVEFKDQDKEVIDSVKIVIKKLTETEKN